MHRVSNTIILYMRNKWKRNYDIKLEKLLGMPHQTAFAKLDKIIIFEQAKELGRTKCYQCGFDIESAEDLSREHKEPYGGNEAREVSADPQLFWNYKNIAYSHKWCNSAAGNAGTGKYKYIGIHDFFDKR